MMNDVESRLYTVTGDSNVTLQVDLSDSKRKASSSSVVGMEDKIGMVLLLLLYTLQGIPMGLCGSIPLIMKERGVSYEGLSLFSLVSIPFSLKLLWAPLVDSCYFRSIGRRKTWIIPVQILTGIVMLVAAPYVDSWMGNTDNENGIEVQGPQVAVLTVFFLFLYFLMATQDIVVDGWALTMLSRENVGYASVCNSIGQSFGYFIANQGDSLFFCLFHISVPLCAGMDNISP
jgi:PAT family acetyl-CoA transporter-like MFS transporter 1